LQEHTQRKKDREPDTKQGNGEVYKMPYLPKNLKIRHTNYKGKTSEKSDLRNSTTEHIQSVEAE